MLLTTTPTYIAPLRVRFQNSFIFYKICAKIVNFLHICKFYSLILLKTAFIPLVPHSFLLYSFYIPSIFLLHSFYIPSTFFLYSVNSLSTSISRIALFFVAVSVGNFILLRTRRVGNYKPYRNFIGTL